MHSPQAELNMMAHDEIFIIIQSFKIETAEDAIFTRILNMVDRSPYFKKKFPRNMKMDSELHFPNNIVVKPITGSINAIQSKNVIGGCITEINEMPIHKTSVQLMNTDKQVLDVGAGVFRNFRNRVIGRFKKHVQRGDFIGRIIIDSARRYLGDFTDRKTEEAKTDPLIMVIERSLWSARPFDYVGEKRFLVELANDYRAARILAKISDAEEWSDEYEKRKYKALLEDDDWLRNNLNVIRVPESHRKDFEKDLEDGLKDFAGVPSTATGRFIPYPKEITRAQEKFVERTGGMSLFLVESVVLTKDMPWHELINMDYVQQLILEGEHRWAVHCDTSLGRQDATGLGVVRIIDRKIIEKGFFYDPQLQEVRRVSNVKMPVYMIDGALEVRAASGEQIDLLMLADLVLQLKKLGIKVVWGTADWIESTSMLQTWRGAGIVCGKASVDKTPDAYFEYRHSIRDERILMCSNSILDTETRQLIRLTKKGSVTIDHPQNGCFTGDTRVALLDGSLPTFVELRDRFGDTEEFYVYSIYPGGVGVGVASNPRITRKRAHLLEIILDNHQVVRCTPDHLFMTIDQEWIQAQRLTRDVSLMPLYRSTSLKGGWMDYEHVWCPVRQERLLTHKLVAEQFLGPCPLDSVVHHSDRNRCNNIPPNLSYVERREHARQHTTARHREDPDWVHRLRKGLDDYYQDGGGREASRNRINRLFSEGKLKRGREVCSVEGCLRMSNAKGLCDMHYQRNKRSTLKMASGRNTNHRILSIRPLKTKEDVWDITVDETGNFALGAGIFVHNSKNVSDGCAGAIGVLKRMDPLGKAMAVEKKQDPVNSQKQSSSQNLSSRMGRGGRRWRRW